MQDKKVYNRKESKVKSTLKKTLNEENLLLALHNNKTSVFRSNKKLKQVKKTLQPRIKETRKNKVVRTAVEKSKICIRPQKNVNII